MNSRLLSGPELVAVAKHAVWVGVSTGVWRIDPGTRSVRPSGAQWTAAGGATVDPHGNAWFTDGWGHVVYISHDAGLRERHAQSGEPSGIAWGSGGVWVALPHTGAVARFSDSGESGPLINVSGEPTAVAFGEGAVWVADARAGTITRIDPLTAHKRITTLGGRLSAIAVGDGAVWATAEPRSAVASGSGAVTYTDDARHLVTTAVTGSGPSATMPGSVVNGMVDWSPDASRLVYVDVSLGRITTNPACAVQACSSIHVMRFDGTGRRQLTHPSSSPATSPLGCPLMAGESRRGATIDTGTLTSPRVSS